MRETLGNAGHLPTVAVFGSINVDLNLTVARHPHPGETLLGGGGSLSPGGKGANQALACVLAGAKVAMLGAVGQDQNADVAVNLLRKHGVDLGGVNALPGPTGLAVVTVAASGENTVLVVPGANGALQVTGLEATFAAISKADLLIMQGEIPRDCLQAAAAYARTHRVRLLLNLAPAIEIDAEVLRGCDPLVVNEHEACQAAAILRGEAVAGAGAAEAMRDFDPQATLRELLQAGVPTVVLTLGAEGALVGEGGGADGAGFVVTPIASIPTEVVDTVGAGDAFVGALAAQLVAGQSLVTGAQAASRFAAATVRFPGAAASYEAARAYLEPGA